jgi:thiol:disulfide interchange protein
MPTQRFLIPTVLLLLVLAAGITAAQSTRSATATPQAAKPSLIIVQFHADWCKACSARRSPTGPFSS